MQHVGCCFLPRYKILIHGKLRSTGLLAAADFIAAAAAASRAAIIHKAQ
jgi:hypothetical protein